MKKLVLSLVLLLALSTAASAQVDRTIGLRFGWPMEISYQHPTGDASRFDLGIGFPGFRGVYLSGTYEWVKDISSVSGLAWYYGIGAQVGYWGSLYLDAHASVGLQYDLEQHINFPLLISADWRPGVGFWLNSGSATIAPALGGGAFAIRYKF